VPEAAYLEIGTFKGSTFCSALHGNKCRALSVDNWSQFGGPFAEFLQNLAGVATKETNVSFVGMEFRAVPYSAFGPFNVYFFDADHTPENQYDALKYAMGSLTREFIFIVDDWNWNWVRNPTMNSIRDLGLEVLHGVEIRTTEGDLAPQEAGIPANQDSDWHNGYFIGVLRKGPS
jgi:hypothetical protein